MSCKLWAFFCTFQIAANYSEEGYFVRQPWSESRPPFTYLIGAAWSGSLNFVQQIVSEKSIKSDPSVPPCNFWNQSAHGLVWICNSTPFSPPKRNRRLSITLCSHLRAEKLSAPRHCHLKTIMLLLRRREAGKENCFKSVDSIYKYIDTVFYVKYLSNSRGK